MSTKAQRAWRLIEAYQQAATQWPGHQVRNRLEDVRLNCEGYAEPGYGSADGDVIAFADWNTVTRYDREAQRSVTISDLPKRLSEALERLGVSIEWSDEWCDCFNCGKAVRTSPDSYGWTRSYSEGDGELTCVECLEENAAEHLESLEGNADTANTIDAIDPADHGYVRLEEDFETGFHRGQDARPENVAKWLRARGVERFLFQIDDVGQFDTTWSAWVHESEKEKLGDEQPTHADADGPSISEAMERGLREATVALSALPEDEGVKVATVHADGTATARTVSREDFIAGKALDK